VEEFMACANCKCNSVEDKVVDPITLLNDELVKLKADNQELNERIEAIDQFLSTKYPELKFGDFSLTCREWVRQEKAKRVEQWQMERNIRYLEHAGYTVTKNEPISS
jgi:hypothetical protein